MPTIESRICFDYNFNMFTRMYEGIAYIQNGHHWEYGKQELIAKVEDWDAERMKRKLRSKVKAFLEEWPTCDQTSTSELQYRKTIISSCGRLTVKESLS
ncbi:hypothetical protein D3A55_0023 [Klebsiella phage K1-ULIP33]|uniref:Uncharacterized protein n=1 Tax=Klebsiella phage K1-ULIP33 TaxID=2307015 RepID=A0A4P6DIP4_9CAUD|nr:hypothetical protein D3A55_0023 [Klebsiella phage K1-ULIP33]